jgi:hypothetical protein
MIWAKLLMAPPLVLAFLQWLGPLVGALTARAGIAALWQPLLMLSAAIVGMFTLGWRLNDRKRRSAWVLAVVGLLLFMGEIPEPTREWKSPDGESAVLAAGDPAPFAERLGRASVLGALYAGGLVIVFRASRRAKGRGDPA